MTEKPVRTDADENVPNNGPFLSGQESVPCFCSQRWILAYIGFLGCICVYLVRVNMTIAMVCMVKYPTYNVSSLHETFNNQSICIEETEHDRIINENAEFEWGKNLRSSILSSFFYGYMITQIPGGWLADRFGGRRVIGYTLLSSALLTLLIPVSARNFLPIVFVLRALIGLLTGVTFPAFHSMWGRWAPPLERSKLVAFTYIGANVGTIIILMTGGVLCEYGFDNGWGSIFYLSGGITVIWVVLWFFFVTDSPTDNKRISVAEKKYLLSKIEYNLSVRTAVVPWCDVVKSKAVWATIIANFTNNWTVYTLMTTLPMFMKEVLKFDIKKNGLLSSIPYIAYVVLGNVAGQSADFLRKKKILTTTQTRKTYQSFAFIGAGVCMIATGFITCENRYMAVITLSFAMASLTFNRAGYAVNHIDFAPKYAGVLLGLSNGLATIPGILAPVVAGLLTPNHKVMTTRLRIPSDTTSPPEWYPPRGSNNSSQEEWRNVFYVCGGLQVFGCVMYNILASGELEPWARDKVSHTFTEMNYQPTVKDI